MTTGEPYATVQIELAMLPSEKYKRNVVRGVLDLVGKNRFGVAVLVFQRKATGVIYNLSFFSVYRWNMWPFSRSKHS